MVFLADRGETSTIKAWNLRPSLIWKDGEWFELSGSYVNDYSHEVHTTLLFVSLILCSYSVEICLVAIAFRLLCLRKNV